MPDMSMARNCAQPILDAMIISAAPEDKEQIQCIYVAGFQRTLRSHKDKTSDPFAVRLFTGIVLDILSNRQFVAVAGFVIKIRNFSPASLDAVKYVGKGD